MPRFTISVGLHGVLALFLALFWVVPEADVAVALRYPTPRPARLRPGEMEPSADDHPPIVPKIFQPDPVIINDAEEVVVNSIPTNLHEAKHTGESTDFISYAAFKGKG